MGCFDTKTTVTTQVPEATAQEKRATALAEAMQRASISGAGYDIKENPDGTIELVAKADTEEQALEKKIASTVNQRLLTYLEGGSLLSPAQQAAIEAQYTTAMKQGGEDVTRIFKGAESARGIPITPTSPTGGDLARELARMGETLSTAKLSAIAGGETSGVNISNTIRDFQNNLKQQDMFTRMAINENASRNALSLTGMRYGAAGRTTTSTPSGMDTLMKMLAAVGGGAEGVGKGYAGFTGGLGGGGGGAGLQGLNAKPALIGGY